MGTRAEQPKASERPRLRVLYDFEYETRGKTVRIIKDEKLILLKKTNRDWWQVVRPADVTNFYVPEQCTFYVPTGYVIEIQEEPLPESTRFYVDKDKMFNQQQQHSNQEKSPQQDSNKEEPRKHESFRSVIVRKLSGNLGSNNNESSKATRPAKPSKIIKNLRKNSVDHADDKQKGNLGVVSTKQKDTWENSAFGMCFGRDTKNVDAQMLNPFQEELENRVSQRRTGFNNARLGVSKPAEDQAKEQANDKLTKFENIHDKWEKATAQALRKDNNVLAKIKEDAQKRRSASPNHQKNEVSSSSSSSITGTKRLSETEKLYSVVDKSPKPAKKPEVPMKPVESPVIENKPPLPIHKSPSKEDIDRLLINDKRKMWAIETLMSELLKSSSNTKAPTSSNNNESVSGPNQLAQELHEMNVSRRFENAEIQVNLLDTSDTKENTDDSCKRKKKIFDFPPRASVARSPTARSPKLLDEYNEANILNDNDRAREIVDETPSYSNISLRIRREKVPCKLKMPTKDFREEMQLTPSLEKLASEIKFLPASASETEKEDEKFSLDLDCPTTTLSQDSLRLYKRRSKSDGALNKRDPRRRDSVDSQENLTSASHMEIFKPKETLHHHHERKYTQHESQRYSLKHEITPTPEYSYRSERVNQTTRYKLNRKSRSLGDLDCSEMDENKEDEEETNSSYETESRRRYKPVPKLRSKESLRRIKPTPPVVSSSVEGLPTKPVPAKRRNLQTPPVPLQRSDSSFDDLSEIDIERSTAVGFKALLRTSDSGSEEYLQYKTFPVTSSANSSRTSDGNFNLSRSLSDEAILSSTSCSNSASPSRVLDGSIENIVDLPAGWTQSYDRNAKRVCFVNERGDKWFSSSDEEGKIYFFEENSNESSWALPSVTNESPGRVRTLSNGDWPQLFDGNMCILKEGVINKTKITTENGKKLRKAWSSSYAVLTELFLLFFKDAKTFASMKLDQSAAAKPEITVDLNGAFIEPADKLSNRKNVYLINTLLGLQVLIQSDNSLVIAEWYRGIHDAIQRLPFSQEYGRTSSTRE